MLIRTTERDHTFTTKLFQRLNLFSLQGLTLDINKRFTAAIEAIQYEPNEAINIENIFTIPEVKAKFYLAQSLKIPFYYVIYQNGEFRIYNISVIDQFRYELMEVLNEEGYVLWWAKLKGLNQPKSLMEAADRVKNSIFDITLEKYKMAWGGNIDGFMFHDKNFACIIENIYTQKNPLESPKGEPSYYFHMRGPNYNTWFPTVKLASILNVPLFLFTIEGLNNKERIGFAVIDHLSTSGVYYREKKPNENIIEGLDNIVTTINNNLASFPPKII